MAAAALATAERGWSRRQNALVADALAWALHLAGRDAEAIGYADRAASISALRTAGITAIAADTRHHARESDRTLALRGIA